VYTASDLLQLKGESRFQWRAITADPGQIQQHGSDAANYGVAVSLGNANQASGVDSLSANPGESLRELMLRFAGSCSGPADMSSRHDYYAHGTSDE
jgi:hypothetical protein